MGILIEIGGKAKELQLFDMYLLGILITAYMYLIFPFQGTISNWTTYSKAVS